MLSPLRGQGSDEDWGDDFEAAPEGSAGKAGDEPASAAEQAQQVQPMSGLHPHHVRAACLQVLFPSSSADCARAELGLVITCLLHALSNWTVCLQSDWAFCKTQ